MMTCSLHGTVRIDSLRARFPESLGLRHAKTIPEHVKTGE
jgi:hypothetical protein